ncbi:hypothetical protein [Geminocystis herdmanii]|uniref:hypothetical protein n=1 Tax=Geminocystis herdmanii TaxID=669359 RepID=UPI00037587AE|nr:hypothetical protein [Geminocystis herdmanii]
MKNWRNIAIQSLLIPILLSSCASNPVTQEEETTEENTSSPEASLILVANGEDFIRQGFVSKDGWRIDFNHAYVTLADTIAHQTEPPFNAEGEEKLQSLKSVTLVREAVTVDLAEGDENAPPIKVAEALGSIGNYNALEWKLVNSGANSNSVILEGIAKKDNESIAFTLNLPLELSYQCGEFVGDERKGFLEAGKTAEVEATFHFDHLFGDNESPADDELNVGALGFQPLANLASNGTLNTDLATLKQNLTSEDYDKLIDNLNSLGHVGEGHCKIN